VQWRDAATTAYAAVELDHEVCATGARVGCRHAIDLGVVNREAGAVGPEFRHHATDDRGKRRVVGRIDRANDVAVFSGGHTVGRDCKW